MNEQYLDMTLSEFLDEIKREEEKADLILKQAELERSEQEKAELEKKAEMIKEEVKEMKEPITSLYENAINLYLAATRFENEDGRPRSAVPYNEYTAAYLMITGAYDPDSFDYKKMIALDNAVNGTHNDWLNDMSNLLINPPLNPLVIDTMKNIRPYSSQEYVDCFPHVTPTIKQLTVLSERIEVQLKELGITRDMSVSDVQNRAIELTKDLPPIDLDKEIVIAKEIFSTKDNEQYFLNSEANGILNLIKKYNAENALSAGEIDALASGATEKPAIKYATDIPKDVLDDVMHEDKNVDRDSNEIRSIDDDNDEHDF